MGVYDYVRCDVPLPDGKETPPDLFQTKDFDYPYLEHYVITSEGRLIKLPTPGNLKETDMNWHGTVNFYGGISDEWREFNAKFTDGQLVEIIQVLNG